MTKHKLNISLKEYNETCLFLESIDFVRWDRLHVTPKDNSLTVYGWIKNSKPRDFMIVLFEYSKKSSRVTTSSLNPKIVKKLEELFGESDAGIKVKDALDIGNTTK